MTKTTKTKTSILGDLRRLQRAQDALEAMQPEERLRAFNWFKSKYSKEWPHDQSY